MSRIEIFANLGLYMYNDVETSYNRSVVEYESEFAGIDAANQAAKILNVNYEKLTKVEQTIRDRHFYDSELRLTLGDIVAVDSVPYMYFPMGWKQL